VLVEAPDSRHVSPLMVWTLLCSSQITVPSTMTAQLTLPPVQPLPEGKQDELQPDGPHDELSLQKSLPTLVLSTFSHITRPPEIEHFQQKADALGAARPITSMNITNENGRFIMANVTFPWLVSFTFDSFAGPAFPNYAPQTVVSNDPGHISPFVVRTPLCSSQITVPSPMTAQFPPVPPVHPSPEILHVEVQPEGWQLVLSLQYCLPTSEESADKHSTRDPEILQFQQRADAIGAAKVTRSTAAVRTLKRGFTHSSFCGLAKT